MNRADRTSAAEIGRNSTQPDCDVRLLIILSSLIIVDSSNLVEIKIGIIVSCLVREIGHKLTGNGLL